MGKYLGIERNMWADSYSFFLKWVDSIPREDTWEIIGHEADELVSKYNNHPTMVKLVLAAIEQLRYRFTPIKQNGLYYYEWENSIKRKMNN